MSMPMDMIRTPSLMIENTYNLYCTPKSKRRLAPDFVPGPYDVICARGKAAYDHPGNQRFRDMVQQHQVDYANASTKHDKSKIVSLIVNTVRQSSPNGGFVKQMDGPGGYWVEVGDRAAKEKIGQTFRDLLHTMYTSSTKAKAQARFQRRMDEENAEDDHPAAAPIPLRQQVNQHHLNTLLPLEFPALLTIPPFRMKPSSAIINNSNNNSTSDTPSIISAGSNRSLSMRFSSLISSSTRSRSNPFSESSLMRSSMHTVDIPPDDYSAMMMMMNDSIPSGVFPDERASTSSNSSTVKPYGIFSSSARSNTNPMLACSSSITSQNNPLLVSSSRGSFMSFDIDELMEGMEGMGMSMNFIEEGEEEEVQ